MAARSAGSARSALHSALRIGLVGDRDDTVTAHRAIPAALGRAAAASGVTLDLRWLPTDCITSDVALAAQFASQAADCAAWFGSAGSCVVGTIIARILALGASTPWKRIRCRRRARTQAVRWTVCAWRGVGPLARRALQAAVAPAQQAAA